MDGAALRGGAQQRAPAERFLYLGWRNAAGNFAQRLKLPIWTITPDQVRQACTDGRLLTATLVDHAPAGDVDRREPRRRTRRHVDAGLNGRTRAWSP